MSRSFRKRRVGRRLHASTQSKSITQNSNRLRPAVAMLLLGLSVIAVVFFLAAQSAEVYGSGPGQGTSSTPVHALCGVAGKPACQRPPIVWITMRSESPSDIIAAAQSTPMYKSSAGDHDLVGNAIRQGSPGTPVLVMPYHDAVGLPELWVIPVVNAHNIPLAMLTFTYDPVHHRLRASEFSAVTGDMFYTTRSFPSVSESEAIAAMQREHHVTMQIGSIPVLIYFPSDHAAVLKGTNTWTGGGTAPINPIWRVAGGDGHFHYIDQLGHAHFSHELQVDPLYPAMP